MTPQLFFQTEPHSSVGSVADLRTGRWFDPRLGQYSFRRLMIVIQKGFIPVTAVRCFDISYVGKQPVVWKECCAEYCLKKTNSRKAWIGVLVAAT